MSQVLELDLSLPVRLIPVHIQKPWGQEIWFTGMEARGESLVEYGDQKLPISAYLNADPAGTTANQPLLLLKVLDPNPKEVVGDLYFEVHETKQEVYIVTHIDHDAWPDAVGRMRFGMSQQRRAEFPSDQAFRRAYGKAVENYEAIRRQIDEGHAEIAQAAEQAARTEMESFTSTRDLRIGDVVQVPTWTPHSLQHGVRVVEFQTQTYERFIISFAQQVLTQDHWDSEHAIANMSIETPPAEKFEQVAPGAQRIARFEDFNVWRVDLDAAGLVQLPAHLPYAVCMCIEGSTSIGALELQPEQACLLPRTAIQKNALQGTGQTLIAAPNL